MTTRVLLINRQLVFAVMIKQALEQTGAFVVHPFTSADAALEYLRDHPHDVALLDFTLPDYNGPQLVRRLRAVQPNIAVIVSPAQPNARALMQELDLQGVVDAPFSARTIIPVIKHAVELIKQPPQARAHSLVDGVAPDASAANVPVEAERKPLDLPSDWPALPRQTQPLSDLSDQPDAAPFQTARLDDDAADFPPPRPVRIVETRILDDVDDDEPLPWERPAAPGTPNQPTFSSLDSILMDEAPSEIFEPAVGEEDTPSVPTVDSDAVRQFLATYHPMSESDTFGDVLGAIDSAAPPAPSETYASDSFDDLVNSMRADRQRTPLPDRHQQFIEFILTGGMDSLLSELEKAKTGELEREHAETSAPALQPDSFSVLAAEEPPLPTLEESGTVGDLMIGVSDASFRNVLALMRGEPVISSEEAEAERSSADFEDFYPLPASDASPSEDDDEAEQRRHNADQALAPFFVGPEAVAPPRELSSAGIPARLILETAQDESTPADSFSLETLIEDIERQLEQHLPEVKPLPSWGEGFKLLRQPVPQPSAAEDVVQEPEFLSQVFDEPEAQPEPAVAPTLPTWDDVPDEAFETTLASKAQRELIEAELSVEETEVLFSQVSSIDEQPLPDELARPQAELGLSDVWETFIPAESYQADALYSDEAAEEAPPTFSSELPYSGPAPTDQPALPAEHPTWLEALLPAAPSPLSGIPSPTPVESTFQPAAESASFKPPFPPAAAERPEADDPYIAQLALSLTQVSLELTAEATLLTRGGEIVAVAGTLAPTDIEALRGAISDEWTAGKDDARIRFLALDNGGREFMVYSRKTVGGFTLSMIFAGTTPLRDIRRQGKRLAEALAAVPETPSPPISAALAASPAAAVSASSESTQSAPPAPYTYMWLLRDPTATFSEVAAQALTTGLRAQLTELGWRIQTMRVQDEYIYVYADVPGEQTPFAVADDLKRRAAGILGAQGLVSDPGTVWADSYLVLTPGRELDADEIAQFIEFERML